MPDSAATPAVSTLGVEPPIESVEDLRRLAHRPAEGVDPGLLELNALGAVGKGVGSALGNVGKSIWDFISVPADVWRGKYTPSEIEAMAPRYALGLAGAATPIGAAAIPEESLGMFGGTRSLTKSTPRLWAANSLEKLGVSRDAIHAKTGWFRGPDGKWRYTISDEPAELAPAWESGEQLQNVLLHPDLYAAYLGLRGWSVTDAPPGAQYRAQLGYGDKTIRLNPERTYAVGNVLSPLLHEVQHAVQGIEGWPSGGSMELFLPEEFAKLREFGTRRMQSLSDEARGVPGITNEDIVNIRSFVRGHDSIPTRMSVSKLPKSLQAKIEPLADLHAELSGQAKSALDKYRRLSGEVEARAVQEQLARRDWATPVWKHEGYIPFEEQTLGEPLPKKYFEDTPRGYSLVPVDYDPFANEVK